MLVGSLRSDNGNVQEMVAEEIEFSSFHFFSRLFQGNTQTAVTNIRNNKRIVLTDFYDIELDVSYA